MLPGVEPLFMKNLHNIQKCGNDEIISKYTPCGTYMTGNHLVVVLIIYI